MTAGLQNETGADIVADKEVSARRLNFFTPGLSVGKMMYAIARLTGLEWRKERGGKDPRYTLFLPESRRKQEPATRRISAPS